MERDGGDQFFKERATFTDKGCQTIEPYIKILNGLVMVILLNYRRILIFSKIVHFGRTIHLNLSLDKNHQKSQLAMNAHHHFLFPTVKPIKLTNLVDLHL